LYLWTGVQPAAMPFGEFVLAALPVGIVGVAMYLFSQRWLADPRTERGIHWRGLMLKVACWPIFLAGTLLAIVHAEIPYIPTAKEVVRGRFFRLAWPHLVVVLLFATTLVATFLIRATRTPEEVIAVTSEAVWGMLGFAALSVLLLSGGIYAAWTARTPRAGAAWDAIDVANVGESVR
jgi:cellulose synthase (UDP-forming)